MKKISYALTGESAVPSVITVGANSSPVWLQHRWEDGGFAYYIRKNGCGHCCAAMAANLHGKTLNPYGEYLFCRELWGPPGEHQDHFQTVSGIVKVLTHLGVKAKAFGVPDRDAALVRILDALAAGKQVIFWSQPGEHFPENPFSQSAHYVLAAGIQPDGKILIANSSEKAAPDGIQTVKADEIGKALYEGSTAEDLTWGVDDFSSCAGYVIVE